jgi:hypothetical protein
MVRGPARLKRFEVIAVIAASHRHAAQIARSALDLRVHCT